MLFESEQKADNFIRFNAEAVAEATGKAPVRSYYCALCCGWHVTSAPLGADASSLDRRDVVLLQKSCDWEATKTELKALSLRIRLRMAQIDAAIARKEEEIVQRLIAESFADLDEMKRLAPRSPMILRPERQLKKRCLLSLNEQGFLKKIE